MISTKNQRRMENLRLLASRFNLTMADVLKTQLQICRDDETELLARLVDVQRELSFINQQERAVVMARMDRLNKLLSSNQEYMKFLKAAVK